MKETYVARHQLGITIKFYVKEVFFKEPELTLFCYTYWQVVKSIWHDSQTIVFSIFRLKVIASHSHPDPDLVLLSTHTQSINMYKRHIQNIKSDQESTSNKDPYCWKAILSVLSCRHIEWLKFIPSKSISDHQELSFFLSFYPATDNFTCGCVYQKHFIGH